jgi:hypothetical protein
MDYTATVERLDLPKLPLINQIIFAVSYIRRNECLPNYEPKMIIMSEAVCDKLWADKHIGPYLSFVSDKDELNGIRPDFKLMNNIYVKVLPWIDGWCVI